MLDNGMLADQIRANADVSFADAQAAAYMALAAGNGWTMALFQERTSMSARDARDLAYRFGIVFPDYDPKAAPRELTWVKAAEGWELRDGIDVIGLCKLTDNRENYGKQCEASACGAFARGWNAQRQMQIVATDLDAKSADLFGGLVVRTRLETKHGSELLFLPEGDEIDKCRGALHQREAA